MKLERELKQAPIASQASPPIRELAIISSLTPSRVEPGNARPNESGLNYGAGDADDNDDDNEHYSEPD